MRFEMSPLIFNSFRYNRTRAPHKQRPEIDALEIDPRLLSNNPNFGFPLYLHEDKGAHYPPIVT